MEIFNEIAREIKDHTNKTVNRAASFVGLEFGTITSSGLKLDNFKYEIKDYFILQYLKLDENYFTDTSSTNHSHNVNTPEQLKPLKVGDRVLVASVNKADFVVVGRIENA